MKEKAKNMLMMSAVVNCLLGMTVFPLIKTTIIKQISQTTYLTGDWMSMILLMFMSKIFMNKDTRNKFIDKYIYQVVAIDILLYTSILIYSLNGNISFRYIGICITSATTTYVYNLARSVYTKRLFKGEELIALDQKIEYYISIASIIGGAVGIALAHLNISYVPLCITQIIFVLIMTVYDILVFKIFRKIEITVEA